jgi:hypothetical protein
MEKVKNSLIVEDHDSESLLGVLNRQSDIALRGFEEGLTVGQRLQYFRDRGIELELFQVRDIMKAYDKARIQSEGTYPKVSGEINPSQIIIGEEHEHSANWDIYPRLLKDLKTRGYDTFSVELPPDKGAQEMLNQAFSIASNRSLSDSDIANEIFDKGVIPSLVFAFKNDMRVVLVDDFVREPSQWDKSVVPSVVFDPENPNTIIDEHMALEKGKEMYDVVRKRNLVMAENISALGNCKLVHIGGRNHNLGLQSLLSEKSGNIPVSVLLDYPDNRARRAALSEYGEYAFEYPRDIITLVDNLWGKQISNSAVNGGEALVSSQDYEQDPNQSPHIIKAFMLSGIVGMLMTRAASLAKGVDGHPEADEHRSRIFLSLLTALSQVAPINIDLEREKQLHLKGEFWQRERLKEAKDKERKREEEDEKKDRENKRKLLEEKKERQRKAKMLSKESEGSEVSFLGLSIDALHILSVFSSLVKNPSITPINFELGDKSKIFNQDLSDIGSSEAFWLMSEAGINPEQYFDSGAQPMQLSRDLAGGLIEDPVASLNKSGGRNTQIEREIDLGIEMS